MLRPVTRPLVPNLGQPATASPRALTPRASSSHTSKRSMTRHATELGPRADEVEASGALTDRPVTAEGEGYRPFPAAWRTYHQPPRGYGGATLDLSKTVDEVMNPAPNSASYISERDRLQVRTCGWTPPNAERQRQTARLAAMGARQLERDDAFAAQQQALQARVTHQRLELGERLKAYKRRVADWQQVLESRASDHGKGKPPVESAPCEGWDGAPPHAGSHWLTIAQHHSDPVERQFVKTISSFKKSFHEQHEVERLKKILPEAPRIVWGGVHSSGAQTAR